MKNKKKKADKPAKSSDDSGLGMLDGKPGVTMKDVLIGRGVINKDGEKTNKPAKKMKKKAKKESIDVRGAIIEGFKRACWGESYNESMYRPGETRRVKKEIDKQAQPGPQKPAPAARYSKKYADEFQAAIQRAADAKAAEKNQKK